MWVGSYSWLYKSYSLCSIILTFDEGCSIVKVCKRLKAHMSNKTCIYVQCGVMLIQKIMLSKPKDSFSILEQSRTKKSLVRIVLRICCLHQNFVRWMWQLHVCSRQLCGKDLIAWTACKFWHFYNHRSHMPIHEILTA